MLTEHERPTLKALLSGQKTELSREEMMAFMQEAAPRLRPYNGPATPPNPNNLPWLVVGSAACVYNDLQHAPEYGPVVAVNQAMFSLPVKADIGVTLHHEITRELAQNYPGRLFCARGTDYVTDVLPVREDWKNGTSGLFAVQVALSLGAKKIILCGIPIDDGPHFNTERGLSRGTQDVIPMHRKPWIDAAAELRNSGVRSMSGWTRGLLGGPDDYMI